MRASQLGAASLLSTWSWRRAVASPRVGAVGIQLYMVNIPMQDDPGGTLKKLRKIGFREVESAGLGKLSASQFRQLLDDAGLPCPSAHLQFDINNLGRSFEEAHALGAKYATSSSLQWLQSPMGLDEAQRTAALANHIGEEAKRAGALKKEISDKIKAEPAAAGRLVQTWIRDPKAAK